MWVITESMHEALLNLSFDLSSHVQKMLTATHTRGFLKGAFSKKGGKHRKQ